jgi:molybdenum cofactor synthesis domain-containing protein
MILRFGVLTISDRSSKGKRVDLSGPALMDSIKGKGWIVQVSGLVPDSRDLISATIIDWCSKSDVDVVLTTGGTGFSPADLTPEATRDVIERDAPGLADTIRNESLKFTRHAILSRGMAGIRGRTIIINLPGSPGGAVQGLESVADVLEHAVQLLRSDENAEQGHSIK